MNKPDSSKPLTLGPLEFASGLSPLVIVLLSISCLLILATIATAWALRDSFNSDTLLLVILVGIVPALCGLYGMNYLLNRQSVHIHKNGFILKSSEGTQTVFWRDIKEFYEEIVIWQIQGVPVKRRKYSLSTGAVYRIELEQNIRRVSKIGDRIRNETFKVLFPLAFENIRSGKAVSFGAVTLMKDSISIKGRDINLASIKKIKSNDGQIILKGASFIGGEAIDYARTPNAHVLFALLLKLVRQN
jgi:uncharacterized protein DUF6585